MELCSENRPLSAAWLAGCDPRGSSSITTWNLNVEHGPATAICLPLLVCPPGHGDRDKQANTLTCSDLTRPTICTDILHKFFLLQSWSAVTQNQTFPGVFFFLDLIPGSNLLWFVFLCCWLTERLNESSCWRAVCLALAYLWADWLWCRWWPHSQLTQKSINRKLWLALRHAPKSGNVLKNISHTPVVRILQKVLVKS